MGGGGSLTAIENRNEDHFHTWYRFAGHDLVPINSGKMHELAKPKGDRNCHFGKNILPMKMRWDRFFAVVKTRIELAAKEKNRAEGSQNRV